MNHTLTWVFYYGVPGQGFEPQFPGSEPGVLPLDDPGMWSHNTEKTDFLQIYAIVVTMNWTGIPYWKRGGRVGVVLAGVVFVLALLWNIKSFVVNNWSNVDWAFIVFIHGFLAVVISIVMTVPALLILWLGGMGIGWLYGKTKT